MNKSFLLGIADLQWLFWQRPLGSAIGPKFRAGMK
jgi:hypothetical protein